MATYAQRLTAVNVLQRAGLGLVAIADPVDDVIFIKDPDIAHVPTGGAVTPTTGQSSHVTWRSWNGVEGQTAYGL